MRTCVWCVVCGVGCALGRALCGCASLTMGNARPPTSLCFISDHGKCTPTHLPVFALFLAVTCC